MNLKTYRAFTMQQALDAVKQDLGDDAVVLSTRSIRKGGFLGFGGRQVVEIIATPAEEAGDDIATTPKRTGNAERRPRVNPAADAATDSRRSRAADAYLQSLVERVETAPTSDVADTPAEPHPMPSAEDRQKTRDMARAMLRDIEARKAREVEQAEPTPAVPVELESVAATPPVLETAEPAPEPTVPVAPVARRFRLQSVEEPAATTTANGNGASIAPPAAARSRDMLRLADPDAAHPDSVEDAVQSVAKANNAASSADLGDELSAIRHMVGRVLHQQTRQGGASVPSMPQALFDYYLKLVGQDLSEELADQIINEVRDALTTEELTDAERVRREVVAHLSEHIPCAETAVALESPDDRPLTIALVGPTGVGKTTTIAKLAATFKLRHGRRVGLITSDTYRIAAVDQLRTYANIIGLPLQVVLTPSEMQQAVHALADCEVILIDSAGRSQNDHERIAELRKFLEAASPHEVHLVLSSTASERVMIQEAESFSAVGVDKVVFTKLDEAVSFGMLVNVAHRIGKSMSFLTNGQEVPDHIEASEPRRLAELIVAGTVSE